MQSDHHARRRGQKKCHYYRIFVPDPQTRISRHRCPPGSVYGSPRQTIFSVNPLALIPGSLAFTSIPDWRTLETPGFWHAPISWDWRWRWSWKPSNTTGALTVSSFIARHHRLRMGLRPAIRTSFSVTRFASQLEISHCFASLNSPFNTASSCRNLTPVDTFFQN